MIDWVGSRGFKLVEIINHCKLRECHVVIIWGHHDSLCYYEKLNQGKCASLDAQQRLCCRLRCWQTSETSSTQMLRFVYRSRNAKFRACRWTCCRAFCTISISHNSRSGFQHLAQHFGRNICGMAETSWGKINIYKLAWKAFNRTFRLLFPLKKYLI